MDYVSFYESQIRAGKILTSQKVKTIYAKLQEEINNPTKWKFDIDKASKPIEFIETFLKLSDGTMGQPFRLELWQKAYIQALFGFVDSEGNRRFRETLLIVGRKNGKSQLASAIALDMLIADGEASANIYSAATKRDQARLIFDATLKMVHQSPLLSQHLKKRKNDLYFEANFSKMEPLASEARTLEGLNSHLIIIDELHSLQTRAVYDVLKRSTSAKSRKQPLLLMITTAGTVRESIFDELYDYGSSILNGETVDERFLPVFYELDHENEWTNPDMWIKANPGLDSIKSREYIENEVAKAQSNPLNKVDLLCKDFNIRQNQSGSWLTFNDVDNTETFDIEEFRGCYAVGGVDLSSTTDLSSATLIFMKPNSNKKYLYQMNWLPNTITERSLEDKIPYDRWEERGLLRGSGKRKIDYRDITAWFMEMVQEYDIRPLWIGYDSWNAQYWTDEMKAAGFNLEEVRQGYKTLSQPMKEFGAELVSKDINYQNNPIFKWCTLNVVPKTDDNQNIRPIKGRNNRKRIDAFMSGLIAYTMLFKNLESFKNMNS